MAEIKWIKITTDIFDDEKIKLIDSMPDRDAILVIWLKLLTLAGKKNTQGFIRFSEDLNYSDEMLSTVFNRPLNTIRFALQTFQNFNMISISDSYGIFIENWERHQNIDGMEKIRLQTASRVRKYREKNKMLQLPAECNATVAYRNATDKNKNRIREEIYTGPAPQENKKTSLSKGAEATAIPYQEIMDAWNEIIPEFTIRKLTESRRKALKRRWDGEKDMQTLDRWKDFFYWIRDSSFLMGQSKGDRKWSIDFDWMLKESNFTKIREGIYNRR